MNTTPVHSSIRVAHPSALKGRNEGGISPQGFNSCGSHTSQGDALGWNRAPLQGLKHRPAAILPMVLFTVLLIALLGAVFSFRVHADFAATTAMSDRLQSRLAAQAGVDWVKLFLRAGQHSRNAWYDNSDAFHRMLLWADHEDSRVACTTDEFEENIAYRWSIVADDPTDDEHYIRFGLTDEASKLNLNTATEPQLLKLVTLALGGREDADPKAIVDAILDWRDTDKNPRGEAADTEGLYYRDLPKPYKVKNGPFDSVEELLLVKGVTPEVLFGEDFDRNGLLTENEDDGDLSFPPDNEDEQLNRGLYPYVTVFSYESNVASDNRQRLYLLGKEETVRAELELLFPGEANVIDFIVSATRKPSGKGGGKGGGKPGQDGQGGGKPGEGGPGQPNPQDPGSDTGGDPNAPPPPPPGSNRPKTDTRGGPTPMTPGGRPPSPPPPESNPSPRRRGPRQQSSIKPAAPGPEGKQVMLAKFQEQPPPNIGRRGPGGRRGQLDTPPAQGDPSATPGDPSTGPGERGQNPQDQPPTGQDTGQGPGGPAPGGQEGTGDAGGDNTPIRSPADLMFPRKIGQDMVPSPLTPEHLAVLMDRTSAYPPEKKKIEGLININTAPRPVLECLESLTSEQIDAIIATRDKLEDDKLTTPAWLVSEGILEPLAFADIASFLTARAQQFTIESLGYADHQGMVTRLQVVVDMMGPIAQTVYIRDLSYLGATYPIREEDLEQQRAR